MIENKDLITIGFTGLGLFISLTTLYLTQFRPAKITASLGPNIHIYYHPPDGVGIYLPVVFHNRSPTKAIIYKVFLEITDTAGQHFALKWLTSNIIDKENNYIEKGPSAPFKIDGFEAVSDALQFMWFNSNPVQLNFLEGNYCIKLHIWLSGKLRPSVTVTEHFNVSHELADIMKQKKQSGENTTRFFPLTRMGMISFSTGYKPIDFTQVTWR
jgi:hypothetical protein